MIKANSLNYLMTMAIKHNAIAATSLALLATPASKMIKII